MGLSARALSARSSGRLQLMEEGTGYDPDQQGYETV